MPLNFAQALRSKPGEKREPGRDATPSVQQPPPPSDPVPVATPVAEKPPPAADPVPEPTGHPVETTPSTPPPRPRSPADPGRQTKGYTPVTNHLLDDVLPTLDPAEQVVLLRLFRLTRGHRQSRCKVSLAKLITKTGVKRTRLRQALDLLEERGYVLRLPDDVESADIYDRGMNFEMLLEGAEPGRQPTPSAERPRSPRGPNKEEGFKEKDKRDISNCPDCKGEGHYFPEGPGKGIVLCKHPKL